MRLTRYFLPVLRDAPLHAELSLDALVVERG
jgi:hypothetical protein